MNHFLKVIWLVGFCLNLDAIGYAQKVKYKDLFPLLQGKRYEDAEPFLKRFLSEDKNNEHANANLQMGFIYQFKSEKSDILTQTTALLMYADSARYYYGIADKLIDEKEIKRNADFYDAYNRRDLRTGKYGISLSDVRFDIENRTKELRDRSDRISTLGFHYQRSIVHYDATINLFNDIRAQYPNRTKLLLQGDEKLQGQLSDVVMRYDSAMYHFNRYRAVLETIDKPGYNQSLDVRDIPAYEKVDHALPDFTRSLIPVLDFRRWANEVRETISKDVVPMREHIVTYDSELNKLYQKLERDSVSVRNELTKLVDKLLSSQLKKLDPNPFPMAVFGFKQEELDYNSYLFETTALADSADIFLRITTAEKRRARALALDSAMQVLAKFDLTAALPNYPDFVKSQFNGEQGLRDFIATKIEYTQREKLRRSQRLEYLAQRKNWIFTPDGDSISIDLEYRPKGNESHFYLPLVVAPEMLAGGLQYRIGQTAKGYVATFGRGRKVLNFHSFDVNPEAFNPEYLDYFGSLQTFSGDGEQIIIAMFNKSADAVLGQVVRIDLTKGLVWNKEFKTLGIPESLEIAPEKDEVMLTCLGKDEAKWVLKIDVKGQLTEQK
jgi:hypothetical protein